LVVISTVLPLTCDDQDGGESADDLGADGEVGEPGHESLRKAIEGFSAPLLRWSE
jgi:hypothetical protein